MSTPRRARLSSLFEVINATTPEGSGALHFGEDSRGGVVLFDEGRVCWAALPGMGRRLTDRVCDVANVARVEIEAAYTECKKRGVAVGQVLVERRLVSADQLRQLLLDQTAAALVALSDREDEPVWVAHRGRGYQARFTFTLPEVMAHATSAGLAYDPSIASRELAAVVAGIGGGAAFDLEGDPLPLAVGGIEDYDELRALGAWVRSMVVSWPVGAPSFVTASTPDGCLVAWHGCGCVFGVRVAGGTGLVRVLAQVMRRK